MSDHLLNGHSRHTPPTDEQLANFIATTLEAHARRLGVSGVMGRYAATMAMANPTTKAIWLERHAALQRELVGEEWPVASCCGEPRVSLDVDACYDHARLCAGCRTNAVANPGDKCPWCSAT